MKTLLLLRHAKAESRSTGKRGQHSDKDRVLSARGIDACAAMGAYMVAKNYAPAVILASTAARTLETAERIAPLLGAELNIETHDALYLANAQSILHHIHALDDHFSSALFVGHNPGLHELACGLASNTPLTDHLAELKTKFPPCALAVISFECPSWGLCETGAGTLVDFMYPKALGGDG